MTYIREEEGVTIKWNKTDKIAQQVVQEVTGSKDYPVEVDNETAEDIRERYAELIEEKEEE